MKKVKLSFELGELGQDEKPLTAKEVVQAKQRAKNALMNTNTNTGIKEGVAAIKKAKNEQDMDNAIAYLIVAAQQQGMKMKSKFI